jgi:transposase InsO family protein
MAIQREFPGGVRGRGLKLISDNWWRGNSWESAYSDLIYEGYGNTWYRALAFTGYDNPEGNGETKSGSPKNQEIFWDVSRVMRIAKEIIWLNEFASFEEAKEKIGRWIQEDYNKLYVHSQLGYMSPEEFEAKLEEERIRKAA